MRSSLVSLGLASLASAHFLVTSPASIGFDEKVEGNAPCGGFQPDLSNSSQLVDFHAGGDAIALRLTHTQATWLFRVTDDPTAQSGWEQVFPIVMQSGLGDFCEPQITIPDKFVGKKGVIGVAVNAPDGILYQCISANFVEGVNSKAPSACKNSSIKVDFSSDPQLTALLGSGGSGSSSSSNSSSPSSTKGSAPSASPTHNAAASLSGALSLWTVALLGGAFML
ncbi:Uncharacterized protein ESCO_001534 [Escovopsis weberi]|uniref:Copper acquisition factor BIM1-like domain-containing protein n=1 Tax=Escovopsis weberi TaxID=150374 RepID=A0A0M8N8K6_ESCWE|nr:Uncharacterized protein ESCO_001534 [Escovopsis weberi]